MAKFIQILISPSTLVDYLYALDDNGTVWQLRVDLRSETVGRTDSRGEPAKEGVGDWKQLPVQGLSAQEQVSKIGPLVVDSPASTPEGAASQYGVWMPTGKVWHRRLDGQRWVGSQKEASVRAELLNQEFGVTWEPRLASDE